MNVAVCLFFTLVLADCWPSYSASCGVGRGEEETFPHPQGWRCPPQQAGISAGCPRGSRHAGHTWPVLRGKKMTWAIGVSSARLFVTSLQSHGSLCRTAQLLNFQSFFAFMCHGLHLLECLKFTVCRSFWKRDVITKVSYAYRQLFSTSVIIITCGYCKLNIPSLITLNSRVGCLNSQIRKVHSLL